MALLVAFIQTGSGSFDRELAAVRHCIPCVGGQVHDNLLDLYRVGFYSAEIFPRYEYKLNILPNQPQQHVVDFLHGRVQIQKLQILHLLPAKRQQLAGEIRRAPRC